MGDRACSFILSGQGLFMLAMVASFLGFPLEARAATAVLEAGVVARPTQIDGSHWTSIRVHGAGDGVVWIAAGPGGTCPDLAAISWHDASDGGADRPDAPDADVLEGTLPGVDPSQADAIAVDEDEEGLASTLAEWNVALPDVLAARIDEAAEEGDCFVVLRSGDAAREAGAAPATGASPLPIVPGAASSPGAFGPGTSPAVRTASTPAVPGSSKDDQDDGGSGGGGGGGGAAAAEACGSAAGSAGDGCGSSDGSDDGCSGSSGEGDDCSGSGGGGEDCSGGAPDDCRLAHDGTRGHRARHSPTSRLVLALAGIAFFARRRRTVRSPR
jgi:uncharacterized membrane protein YgcG